MIKEIENKINELGYEVGCYDKELDKVLTKKALGRVLNALDEEYTDLYLRIRRKLYIVSISTVDNEKDVNLYTASQYFSRFGNLDDALDYGDITEAEYNSLKKVLGYL